MHNMYMYLQSYSWLLCLKKVVIAIYIRSNEEDKLNEDESAMGLIQILDPFKFKTAKQRINRSILQVFYMNITYKDRLSKNLRAPVTSTRRRTACSTFSNIEFTKFIIHIFHLTVHELRSLTWGRQR